MKLYKYLFFGFFGKNRVNTFRKNVEGLFLDFIVTQKLQILIGAISIQFVLESVYILNWKIKIRTKIYLYLKINSKIK